MPRRPAALYARRPRRIARYARKKRSATAQSKQIVALSKTVAKIADISSVPLKLRWYRKLSFVDKTGLTAADNGKLTVYMCPIPVAPNQIADANPNDFMDTGPAATDGTFRKSKIWVTATDVNQKPRCTHRGGFINYKLSRTNLSLKFYTVMLIRAKSVVADQLSLQRSFQYFDATANPPVVAGEQATLLSGYDFIHNPQQTASDAITGFQMNPQMWDVLHKKTWKFGTNKPLLDPVVNPAGRPTTVGTPMRTEATGYIKIPSGGAVHKVWSTDHTQQASNLDYPHQRSEKNVFLVIFAQRGSVTTDPLIPVIDTAAGELKMTMQVRDNYSCSEGSITPQSTGNGELGRIRVRRRTRL